MVDLPVPTKSMFSFLSGITPKRLIGRAAVKALPRRLTARRSQEQFGSLDNNYCVSTGPAWAKR
jgi:hypothetical protein